MAAISLNKKYKLSFLHPQMSSIWAEFALQVQCTLHVQCTLYTQTHWYMFVHWSPLHVKKLLTEQNRGINLLLTPLFTKP